MTLSKRILTGLLLACSLCAVACGEEKKSRDEEELDAGDDDYEEPEVEDEDEEDDRRRGSTMDASTRRDGGADAGRDGGADAGDGGRSTARGMDAGGPSVTDVDREPAPGGDDDGPSVGEVIRVDGGDNIYLDPSCPELKTNAAAPIPPSYPGCCLLDPATGEGTCGGSTHVFGPAVRQGCASYDLLRNEPTTQLLLPMLEIPDAPVSCVYPGN